jgi:hypothetical protein
VKLATWKQVASFLLTYRANSGIVCEVAACAVTKPQPTVGVYFSSKLAISKRGRQF